MSDQSPRHHLLIAGQGRSGTSLLVKVLSACGLDTHLERHGDEAWWSDAANAGLEDNPYRHNPPYVIKSPYAYQFLDQGLADGRFVLDHAIIPVRRLREGAASRVITELADLLAKPNMANTVAGGGMWEHFGRTPGGVVYSLHEVDAERILATGFTRLVEILVRHDVPMTFLDFPRFVQAPEYLYDRLAPLLGGLSLEEFGKRTEGIIDASQVRVEGEMAGAESPQANLNEIAALRRALADVSIARDELAAEGEARRIELTDELRELREEHAAELRATRARFDQRRADVREHGTELRTLRTELTTELRELRKAHATELRALRTELTQRRIEVREQRTELRTLRTELTQRNAEFAATKREARHVELTSRDTAQQLARTEQKVARMRKNLARLERDAEVARQGYDRVVNRRVVRAALRLAQPLRPAYRVLRAARSRVSQRSSTRVG